MSENIYLTVNPPDIDIISKIIEAYEHLGIVSTLDSRHGLLVIRCTSDTRDDMLQILSNLPYPIDLLDPGR